MKLILFLSLLAISYSANAAVPKSGYYLKWDSDHTGREIRPVYPIEEKDIKRYRTYYVDVAKGKPKKVCFFSFGKPSNSADYGAHCIKFSYDKTGITRSFHDTNNKQVENNEGVYQVRYILAGEKFPVKRQYLDEDNALMNNKSGVAEFYFKRDSQGRTYSEIRRDKQGEVVLEHNGFYEARFDFDENGYATYRRGFDKHGNIMEGKYGYATAHFWFDKNGTFVKEEFRNAVGELVLGPRHRFARIEYRDIDQFGNWGKVVLFDPKGKLVEKIPSILLASYDEKNLRTSLSYFDSKMKPAENTQGVAKYIYLYDSAGDLEKRDGYDINGVLVEDKG